MTEEPSRGKSPDIILKKAYLKNIDFIPRIMIITEENRDNRPGLTFLIIPVKRLSDRSAGSVPKPNTAIISIPFTGSAVEAAFAPTA